MGAVQMPAYELATVHQPWATPFEIFFVEVPGEDPDLVTAEVQQHAILRLGEIDKGVHRVGKRSRVEMLAEVAPPIGEEVQVGIQDASVQGAAVTHPPAEEIRGRWRRLRGSPGGTLEVDRDRPLGRVAVEVQAPLQGLADDGVGIEGHLSRKANRHRSATGWIGC